MRVTGEVLALFFAVLLTLLIIAMYVIWRFGWVLVLFGGCYVLYRYAMRRNDVSRGCDPKGNSSVPDKRP
jgi:hypothetical protein